jgi:hypothetical protein
MPAADHPVDAEIGDVVAQLETRLAHLPEGYAERRTFLQTYLRTTEAIGAALDAASFEDPAWVTFLDVVFAGYFVRAHDADLAGERAPRPWRLAFGASAEHHRLIHLLLGMNAHINYDLPQALLDVISDDDFGDPVLLERRRRDHERIDAVLASRVGPEDRHLGGPRRLRDRALTPLNRWSSRRFLRESRRAVWHNVLALHDARRIGPAVYTERLAELEVLSAAKITDLLAPGQVLLRLAAGGFGVRLPPRDTD